MSEWEGVGLSFENNSGAAADSSASVSSADKLVTHYKSLHVDSDSV